MNKKGLRILIIGFFIIILFIITALIIASFTRTKSYKCYFYSEQINDTTYDVLRDYDYFYLKLNKDNTFVMTLAAKENPKSEIKMEGNYSEDNDTLLLSFTTSHMEFLLFDSLEFVRSGNRLLCTQTVQSGEHKITIFLKFK